MKRRVMLVLRGVSLLACLTTIGFWISGATVKTNGVHPLLWHWSALADCSRNGAYLGVYHFNVHVVGPKLGADEPSRKVANIWMKRFGEYNEFVLAGFWFGWGPLQSSDAAGHITMEGGKWWLGLQLWLIVVLSSVLPLVTLLRYLQRRREIPPGCCRNCGYDLRATRERCPECGAVQTDLLGL